MPRNKDNGTAIAAANPPRKIVFANLIPTNSEISLLLARETPRSPVIIPPSQSKYLKCAGLSKPNSALKTFTVSGVAPCPSIESAKSPGKTSTPKVIRSEIANRVRTPSAIRWAITLRI